MSDVDRQYVRLIKSCLEGEKVRTRNADCYRSICQRHEFTGTPLISLRKTAWRNCLREMAWFLSGSSYLSQLHPSVRPWWQPWAKDDAIANGYSKQFRNFAGDATPIDQIQYLLDGVREHPYSRRNVITTWNTAEMADPLTPITNCHGTVIQAFVEYGKLSLYTYQRSADVIVGVPHNWLQYWAFLLWLARCGGREPGRLIWEGGDCHVYSQNEGLARRMIEQTPPEATPELVYRPTSEDFRAEDFSLSGPYEPAIDERAEMQV